MDLKCLRCMEPWEMDEVIHENPDDFRRDNVGRIIRCPACWNVSNEDIVLSDKDEMERAQISALHDLLGDDLDGIATMMEDFDL